MPYPDYGQHYGNALNHHQMAAEIGVTAVSHLEEIDVDTGISAMSRAGVIATLLPTTVYTLRLVAPPARRMIDAGVAVALGSDLNPNAHCLAMVSVRMSYVHCEIPILQLNCYIMHGSKGYYFILEVYCY